MKNFSAKNAEFETVTINNEAAITSADLGTDPNKIPLNKDLGSLAYQDAVNLDDVSADMLELRAIAAEISDSAVDVFVYDTSRDSDGGAWRKRTQHTSWYNEELNTATRGGRREFPAVAVIVAEADKVTIYDGDDPDLSMWMVFNADVAGKLLNTIGGNTSLAALNGDIFVGCNENVYGGVSIKIAFISDTSFAYANNQISRWPTGISGRDTTVNYTIFVHSYGLVSLFVNDVAMTILPNAPIDENTGLPVPTIAVATDGGVSIIRDNGNVVDLLSPYTGYENVTEISFSSDGRLHFNMYDENRPGRYFMIASIPDKDETLQMSFEPNGDSFNKLYILDPGAQSYTTTIPKALNDNFAEKIQVLSDSRNAFGSSTGLTFLDYNKNITPSINESAEGMAVYTTSKYNTGWMPGDIKLATLSDTTVETIGESSDELVTNEDFVDTNSDGADDWILSNDATTSTSGTAVTITNGGVNFGYIYQVVNTEIGKQYLFSVDVDYISNEGRVFLGKEGSNTSSNSYFHEENINSDKTIEYYFTAETETLYVRIGLQDNTQGGSISFDNISVRATTELITNGDFSIDSDWTQGTGWTISGGVASKAISVNSSNLTQEIDCVIGQTYVVSWDTTSIDSSAVGFYTQSGGSITAVQNYYGSVGSYSETFTATSESVTIALRAGSTAVLSIDNISVRPAVDDRSVNGNGLQIVGAIDKTQVAPSADLVAYSGFSTNNYLVQPYNEDLDFGTGDFLSTWWIYRNDTLEGSVFHRSSSLVTGNTTTSDAILQAEFGASQFQAQVYTSGFGLPSDNSTLTYTGVPSGVWTHMAMSRKSNVLSLYVNGKFIDSVQSDATVTNTNAPMSIGTRAIRSGLARPLNGSLALLRFSATAPTPEQIAKIYRDEKALFQDGAQATLYGTSDAVTALAYDDSNQLLHVGTASGRSDFRGLVRVNNTTTAISNSISVAEGAIIQN